MAQLVSAKGSDIMAWRAAGDFAATFRQIILDRMEFCRSDQAVSLLDNVIQAIEELAVANQGFGSRCETLMEEVAACRDPLRLRELTSAFFGGLYDHFAIHRSAPAFYHFSNLFLQLMARSISRCAFDSLGLSSSRMPGPALVALGPAGRQEFSPFCPLQLMIVHDGSGEVDSDLLSRFAGLVHEGFAACGLLVDETVTPRHQQWRGSLPEWERRLGDLLRRGRPREIIEALRLADQTTLEGSTETGDVFRQTSRELIAASPAAMSSLVSRVVSLSNGIGIMGGLRFEKSGPYRGLFALLDNGLLPLSASLSALALLRRSETAATPRRIRELLWRRELNVDMAERLLEAWHTLHEFSLQLQRDKQPEWGDSAPHYLDIDQLDVAGQELLRESLDAVGTMQRHIGLNFSGLGE